MEFELISADTPCDVPEKVQRWFKFSRVGHPGFLPLKVEIA